MMEAPFVFAGKDSMRRSFVRTLACIVPALALSLPASAQLFRAYVASYGKDENPCTVGEPCRLLPAAIAAIQDGGEIWMLDSANYNQGTVHITKSVSILAIPGQVGSIVPVNNAPAIIVDPGMSVTLRNVSIATNAGNPGTDGIDVTTGALTVIDSFFHVKTAAQANWAINVHGNATVSVRNSRFVDSDNGVLVEGGANADVSGSTFDGIAGTGVASVSNVAGTTTSVNVDGCAFFHATTGALADGTVPNKLYLHISRSTFRMNGVGISSDAHTLNLETVVSVSNSEVVGSSSYGFYHAGFSSFYTYGNNVVRDNGTDTSGTITTISTT